jgi:diguanylate cyclase (GGDEF)-like protein
MATRMFGVPIALVSFVDENRQWFKSCVGLGASETSREISFCGHAILGNGVFVIPNAFEDQRFADNPLVLNDPNIRFYAGCPLSLNGHKLGTLCIIDKMPRSFEKEDVETLKDLASMVERELAAVQLATMDELTNISNRRGFMMMAQHSLSLCTRQNIPAALVFLDLDKFKLINDKFGHAEGDRVLTTFASQMKHSFRASDLFARLGGDEFVVLLTNTSMQQAEKIIGKFHHSLKKCNQEADRGYEIAFSHGIVEFNPEKHTSPEELLADGDLLMYAQKEAKR